MRGKGEYQGGYYAILEFIGLYVRIYFFKLFGSKKTKEYLSGEENFPKINTLQRAYCLFVGLFSLLIFILLLYVFAARFITPPKF